MRIRVYRVTAACEIDVPNVTDKRKAVRIAMQTFHDSYGDDLYATAPWKPLKTRVLCLPADERIAIQVPSWEGPGE